MPTYDYQCEACDHEFEEFQSITAKPIKVCPKCKKRKVKRLIGSGAGLIFKGSGFYVTDYKNKGGGSDKKSDKSDSSSKTEKKSDSKSKASEKKSESKGSSKKSDGKKAS